jgi:site-specific recombinase
MSSLKRVTQLFRPPPFTAALADLLKEAESIRTPDQRIRWFEDLLFWMKRDGGSGHNYPRFKFLFQLLRQRPEWKAALTQQLTLLFDDCSLLRLFLATGYADEHGLVPEIGRRVLMRVLPSVRENSFFEIIAYVFTTEADLNWFAGIPDEIVKEFADLFDDESIRKIRSIVKTNAHEAIVVFAAHLADQGLTKDVRQRSRQSLPSASPFLSFQRTLHEVLSDRRYTKEERALIEELTLQCHAAIRHVYDDMEVAGTSVGLVYRLEVMAAGLARIRDLLNLFDEFEKDSLKNDHLLTLDLIESVLEGRLIFGHIHQRLHLISRKIAERNGVSGDHYIARSAPERRQLFSSALKGGVVVLMMTLLKTGVLALRIPPLLEAVLVWCIYSGGFLFMQFSHSTLATKLPSFTASRLARLMNEIRHSSDLDAFVNEVKTVLKSQGLAFLGNIAALVPLACVLDLALVGLTKRHLFSSEYAHHTLEALHPLLSLAVPLGALTGVLLWISSLAGGWFENWVVYRKMPLAISHQRRLRQIFGATSTEKMGEWLRDNASGIGANLSLGFMFGFIPFVGLIIGVPLDSKHVTISSTSATFSLLASAQDPHLLTMVLTTVCGLVLIGLMNLLVSFALALVVAARASALNPRRFKILLILIGRRFFGK